jgi:predicted alpha/beta superfamily hydrolase
LAVISPSLWDRGSAFLEEEAGARSHADLQAKVFLVVDTGETSGRGWQNNLPDEIGLPLK